MSKWNVWSVDTEKERALVVDEGTRDQAKAAAECRNAAALKLKVPNLKFIALKAGEVPDWDNLDGES